MSDPRIPIRLGALSAAGPGDAVLIEEGALEPGTAEPARQPVARFRLPGFGAHKPGCLCCVPRGPVAEALSELFLARMRGSAAFFGSVLAVPATAAGRRAIVDAVTRDPLVSGRFRLM